MIYHVILKSDQTYRVKGAYFVVFPDDNYIAVYQKASAEDRVVAIFRLTDIIGIVEVDE